MSNCISIRGGIGPCGLHLGHAFGHAIDCQLDFEKVVQRNIQVEEGKLTWVAAVFVDESAC